MNFNLVDSTFTRFLIVGCINTAFGYGIFALAIMLGAAPPVALACSLVCGVIFNFFTTGRLVFGNKSASRLPAFILCYAIVYLANLALLNLIMSFGVGPLMAQLLSLPLVALSTFFLLKLVVYRSSS